MFFYINVRGAENILILLPQCAQRREKCDFSLSAYGAGKLLICSVSAGSADKFSFCSIIVRSAEKILILLS